MTLSTDASGGDTDVELMGRVRTGDRDALARLVDRHKDGLVNYLARLTGQRDHGEELAQEAFLRLFQSASRYREEGRLLPYLYRIATNLVRSEERRERHFRLFATTSRQRHDPPVGASRLLNQEAQRELVRALAKLPLHFRAAVVLHAVQGWTYQDIATFLGCREGTVKSRIHRGHRRLRDSLKEYWTGGPV